VIEGAVDLPAQTRTQWLCSLRQIAKALDKPMEVIPARWTAARFPIDRLHHVVVGLNPNTLANHKANARAALRWFGKEEDVPSRGLPLNGEWQVLRQQLTDRRTRATLSSLMRYFSARKAAPAAVDETAIDAYMRYREQTTALATDAGARRSIARAWNGCIGVIEGWPEGRLLEPAIKTTEEPEWEKFPEGLRRDIEAHISGLTRRSAMPGATDASPVGRQRSARARPNSRRQRGWRSAKAYPSKASAHSPSWSAPT
jgi:hypothetical protein